MRVGVVLIIGFLFLSFITVPAHADTCSSTTAISIGTTYGNTNSSSDNNSGVCGGDGSPEKIYIFTLTSTQNVVISTDNPGTDFDTLLYVRTDCSDPSSYIACNDDVNLADYNSIITLNNLSPGCKQY